MRMVITSDSHFETGVGKLPFKSTEKILITDYGGGVHICIVLMCREPNLKFHRRVRFYKKTGLFGIDVILDYNQMKEASHLERCRIVAEKLLDEIPAIISKRKLPGFRSEEFIADFKTCISSALAAKS